MRWKALKCKECRNPGRSWSFLRAESLSLSEMTCESAILKLLFNKNSEVFSVAQKHRNA